LDPADAADDDERMMLQAPLNGLAFDIDNKAVYMKAGSWTIGTDAYTWFQDADVNDGRGALREIVAHYEGVGEINKKVSAAEATLKSLHYKKDGVFSVEKYVTRLKECFTDLEDSAEGYTERKQVTTLLDGIHTNDSKMDSIKTMICVMHPGDFKAACNMLLTQVSEVYTTEGGNFAGRKRGIASLERGCGRGGGRGRGRGGGYQGEYQGGRGRGGRDGRGGRGSRGGGRGNPNHVVDITDVTRDFTGDEWGRLQSAGMLQYIHTQCGVVGL
jgi:hypothetical protein